MKILVRHSILTETFKSVTLKKNNPLFLGLTYCIERENAEKVDYVLV